MKLLVASVLCLSFVACSATKNLPETCSQQLKNLTTLEQNLTAVRAALEICAANPQPE